MKIDTEYPVSSPMFDQAAALRYKVSIYLLYAFVLFSLIAVAICMFTGRYALIPYVLLPLVLPHAVFLYLIRSTGSYRTIVAMMLYSYTALGLLNLVSGSTFLVDLFLLPALIGIAFLVLKYRHAVFMALYLLLLYGATAIVVYFQRPFELAYGGESLVSVVLGFVSAVLVSFMLYFLFARDFQRNSQALDNTLLALQRVNDDNKLLISVISHDFNNYLNNVLLQIYHAKSRTMDPEQLEGLDNIEASIFKISELLNEARNVRKVFGGNGVDTLVTLRADEMFRIVEMIFRHQIVQKNLRFTFGGDAALELRVHRDVFIHMILANLIGNAIRFSPAGATVSVFMGAPGGCPALIINTTATGEHAPKLRAVAGSRSRVEAQLGTHQVEGEGIGLGIALRFCRLHGIDCRFELQELQPQGREEDGARKAEETEDVEDARSGNMEARSEASTNRGQPALRVKMILSFLSVPAVPAAPASPVTRAARGTENP